MLRMPAMLLLAACAPAEVITIPGRSGSLDIDLLNPTECDTCDPFAGVDTLRLDVLRGEEVVATDSFGYPGDTPTLPGLDGYGVVRFQLVGLSGGVVVSAGRTSEIAVDPDADASISMVFLPVNQGLPLAATMTTRRSFHAAIAHRDGTVLIAGGYDVRKGSTTRSTEVYDPTTGTFGVGPGDLPAAVASPVVVDLPEGDRLLVGGTSYDAGVSSPSAAVAIYDEEAGTLGGSLLAYPRTGHCVSLFRSRQGMVFGGTSVAYGDFFRSDAVGAEFTFQGIQMGDFTQGNVTGCVALSDGRTFLQGIDAASTGLWNYTEETADQVDPGNAFEGVDASSAKNRFASGAVIVPLSDAAAWVASGTDAATGEPGTDARVYRADANGFADAEGLARATTGAVWDHWTDTDWVAVGCGWGDAARTRPSALVELRNLGEGGGGVEMTLDRARHGCALTTLLDGSILVSGGFSSADERGADAALIIPWIED